jgi:MerR family mercuric resistance operon transcriptional regulator
MSNPANRYLTIGKIAEQCGVSRDTIRYYERLGLLPKPARTAGGYRLYSQQIVRRIAVIQNGIRFGFSLKELCEFMRSRDRGVPPCGSVRAAGERLLHSLENQIEELNSVRESMRKTLDEWDERLSRTPRGLASELLANINDLAHPRRSQLRRKHE